MIPGTKAFPVLPFVGWAQLVPEHNWLMYKVQSGQIIEKRFLFCVGEFNLAYHKYVFHFQSECSDEMGESWS